MSTPAPSVHVLLEQDARNGWTPHSLELLCDARTVARQSGGTVAAWVLTAPLAPVAELPALAACGCHQLRHLQHERFAGRASESIAAALRQDHPPGGRLILLPGHALGEEVAALLAEKLATTWIPDVLAFAVTRTGVLEITATQPGGKLSRTFRPPGSSVAVATMRAGVGEVRPERPVDITVAERSVDLADVFELTAVKRFIPADPQTIDLTLAERIVAAGRGTDGPAGVALVAQLAEALRASLGASRMAVDLGWIPPVRQVGQTGRTVTPELYVACGISGASHHLIGMRGSKHIIALNSDPKAPIHDVAHLSVTSDLHRVIPALLAALARRRNSGSPPVP